MKKTLNATTALVAAGLLSLAASEAVAQAAAPAAPEKLKIAVGGFMLQTLGYADQANSFATSAATQYKHFDTKSDTEVYFTGSVKLDNGITVGVNVQLESDVQTAAGTVIDESYMSIAHDTFGTLVLGSTDGAGANLNVQAPWAGATNPYTGDMTAWVVDPGTVIADGMSTGENAGGSNDDNLIRWISPSLAGFRVGVSYASSQTDSANQPLVTEVDQYETGLQYSGKIGDVGLRASAIYWSTQGATDAAQYDGWALGTDVVFGQFTVGGGYGEMNQNGDVALAAATRSAATETWNIGGKWTSGPTTIALTYGHQSADASSADPDEDTHSRWLLGANYVIGPGVTLVGSAMRMTFEDEGNSATLENKGWAVVGGINVDF